MRHQLLRICLGLLLLAGLAGCGQRASERNEQGNQLFDQQRYGEALAEYKAAAQLAPDRPEPFVNAGNARHQLADYLGAIDEQQNALTLAEPQLQAGIYYNLGNSYFRMREYEQAIESYKQTLRLDPADVDAKHNLELAQRQQQQQQQQANQRQQQQQQQPQPQQQQGEDEQQQPGAGSQPPPSRPDPAPPSISREEAEEELDEMRRRGQRRSDDIYRDYAVGGEEGTPEQGLPGDEDQRGW